MLRPGSVGRTLLAAVADALLPAVCPLCQLSDGAALCAACRVRLPALPDPCWDCGAPWSRASCVSCAGRGLPHIRAVWVAWSYEAVLSDLVGLAKVSGDAAAVQACAELVPPPGPELSGSIDIVVPIPANPGRRRGPHLASRIANVAAKRLQRPCRQLLRITRLAAPQHTLSHDERSRNTAGLFAARAAVPARVLLVDDLLTSGATASAAAVALKAGGATEVSLLVLARTPAGRHERITHPDGSPRQRLHPSHGAGT